MLRSSLPFLPHPQASFEMFFVVVAIGFDWIGSGEEGWEAV
jgi:hypothetical protein